MSCRGGVGPRQSVNCRFRQAGLTSLLNSEHARRSEDIPEECTMKEYLKSHIVYSTARKRERARLLKRDRDPNTLQSIEHQHWESFA